MTRSPPFDRMRLELDALFGAPSSAYDIEQGKDRIIGFLAVRRLNPLAAQRNGIRTVIGPVLNAQDVDDILRTCRLAGAFTRRVMSVVFLCARAWSSDWRNSWACGN